VSLHATCCTVQAGEALRLSVQAAAWPAFALNPGGHAPRADARLADCAITTLRIRHAGSRLVLPALPIS
jgi:uncharacterized protein